MPWNLQASIDTAIEVVSYSAGSYTGSLTDSSAALGLPSGMVETTGQYASVLSPFSPPYKKGDLLVFGNGGSITLRLEKYAVVTANQLELGIFGNVGLVDVSGDHTGTANASAGSFGAASATLEVSADGINFINMGSLTVGMFTNFYTDLASPYSATVGTTTADFSLPYNGTISDFAGKTYSQILTQLNGSAGGTWVDLDSSGLTEVGWIRISESANSNFKLDAVTVNGQTVGVETVPEPATSALIWLSLGLGLCMARVQGRVEVRK